MNWIKLTNKSQLDTIQTESNTDPVIIFKHSTSCSISRATLDRLDRNWKNEGLENVKTYFLDLLSYREISNSIASLYQVEHQSPQVLIIRNGKSVYDKSHFEISFDSLQSQLSAIGVAK
jgi:bacillithiol system protein YtxJ